jgi:hypothetical protein
VVKLLPDFERVLGPDLCGRDLGDRSRLDPRREDYTQLWAAPNNPHGFNLTAAGDAEAARMG